MKQQEEALLKAFQGIPDSENRQFILALTQKIAARQAQNKPKIRLIAR